ncbi:hypothetical protein ACHAW5_002504 [Stephanodiscus triporus]|uniref:Uncharacterized protein n=1 Tax=Stephanodiscus triporus TaxID=2934178 RepID=A0ABD3R0L1_9STRA
MATAASSPPSACPPKIQRRTLRGHRGPVLCLAHSSERPPPPSRGRLLPRDHDDDAYHHHHHGHHPSLLLSGSEDGTARLWDLRTRRTSVCMVVPRGGAGGGGDDDDDYDAGVSCVAFHPSIGEAVGDDDDHDEGYGGGDGGPASSTIHLGECAAYVSSGSRVYGYDLRRHVDVASMTTTSTPPMIIQTPHYDLTDDFGCADEINELSFSYPRRGGRNAYLLSAADDSGESVRTSTRRGGRGRVRELAAGVGDGSVAVYRAEGYRLVGVGRFGDKVGGHASAIAAVRFADFAPSAAATTDRRRGRTEMGDRLLISAGNDGNMIFWDLGPEVAGRGQSDPRSYLGCSASPEIDTRIEGNGRDGAATSSSPGVLFKIEHRHKPNWIACGGANDVALPRSVFVADTTNDISNNMPERITTRKKRLSALEESLDEDEPELLRDAGGKTRMVGKAADGMANET